MGLFSATFKDIYGEREGYLHQPTTLCYDTATQYMKSSGFIILGTRRLGTGILLVP